MMKRELVLFVQDKIGGVTILNHNLAIALEKVFDVSVVYIQSEHRSVETASRQSKVKQQLFFDLSYKNKHNYNLHTLYELVKSKDAVFVANDGFELEMYNYKQCHNPLSYVLHGDYDLYYSTAVKFQGIIDKFIAVSDNIRSNLAILLPHRSGDIVYMKHIVPANNRNITITQQPLTVVFIGRLVEEKGFTDLIEIDKQLKASDITVQWKVIADGPEAGNEWLHSSNVEWIRYIDNTALRDKLNDYDIFILPSRAEGFPVSLVEAMKAGLVPMVSHLPGAMDELIEQSVTGFKVPVGSVSEYVTHITGLHTNRQLLKQMAEASIEKVNTLFNEQEATGKYISLFKEIKAGNKRFVQQQKKRSVLESDFVPNAVVKTIRHIKQLIQ